MKEPDYVILFPDGTKYVTTAIAASILKVDRSRIHQFIESGELSSILLPLSANTLIIPLEEFRKFAERPRTPGRPARKETTKKPAKKRRK